LEEVLLAVAFLLTLTWNSVQQAQGHVVSSERIHDGPLQYLTRLLECDMHPATTAVVRPLGPSISSFVTGNWYGKTQDVAYDLVAAANGMAREVILRGMDYRRAMRYLSKSLDMKMEVRLENRSEPLEWFAYREQAWLERLVSSKNW